MSRNRGGKTHRDERWSDDEYDDDEEVSESAGRSATVNEWRNRGGKTHRDDRSEDEFEDKEERGRAGRGATVNELLTEKCKLLETTIKSLQREISVLKSSSERKTKKQLRIDYDWDGENANLSDKVSNWVKTYLFPRYKFLNDGWMAYDKKGESLSSFVQRKMNMDNEDNYQDLWERVISPTIQQKYVTIRCNLNNDVRRAYKSKWQ
jgi:DNA polymerase sigma